MTKYSQNSVGLNTAAGWQIGLWRTMGLPAENLWEMLLSPAGIKIWLGEGDSFQFREGSKYQLKDGTTGEVRVLQQGSHWRITRKPPDKQYSRPSTIQIWIIPKDSQSVLAFHEEHLPNEKARRDRETFYLTVIKDLKVFLDQAELT